MRIRSEATRRRRPETECTPLATPDAADALQAQRRRLLAPLLVGRTVLEAGRNGALPEDSVPAHPSAHIALALDAAPAAEAAELARRLLGRIRPDGLVAVVASEPIAESVLRRLAPHRAHYTQRALGGSLFCEAAFDDGRIAVLRDRAPGAPRLHLYLLSPRPLPPLDTGVLEAPEGKAAAPLPALFAAAPPAMTLPKLPHRPAAPADPVSLARRLLRKEQALLALYDRQRRMVAAGPTAPASPSSGFEPPRATHPWAALDGIVSTDPYDRRPDDPVLAAAAAGAAFFDRFRLESEDDDLDAAIAALATKRNRLGSEGPPDVSIIIPVYGQLPYTLNCLDGLFNHESRFRAEIIVVDDASPDGSGARLAALPQIRLLQQRANGGFIASCNDGAAIAKGRILVLLNNDTRVVEGWLDALAGSFTRFPRAGLIGSKMLYPDGSLQEAGGILWRDGSAWNYGRNDDPNRPQYCYARQADYISGCSIAVPRALWESLGGFDPHYRPAYCEDADLCLRIAAAGHEVWYQPQSRVVHYEGKTSGTDTAHGVKAYQVSNSRKLFLRWRGRLATHRRNGEAPYLEKDRHTRQRLLVVDATTPTPDQDAGSLQTVLALQSAAALGYQTHFVPEDNFLFQPGYTSDLQAAGTECAYAPYELGMENTLRRYGRLFDVILVYRVSVLERNIALIRQYAPQAALLYHVADLHFLRLERQAEIEGDAALRIEAAGLRARELALVGAADATVTHSEFEAALLREVVPDAAVAVWPLMFQPVGTARGAAERSDVVFLGGYRHQPNVDAAQFFAADILPRLQQHEPHLRFIAAGANPTAEIAALAGPAVEVTGLVPDLGPLLDRARVFVCPLRFGAGVKGKVMTALAHGIPVVTTSIGIEGTGLEPEREVLVADDAETFCRQTLRLYRDPDLWHRLSRAGLERVEADYAPRRGAEHLERAIDEAWRAKFGLAAA